MFLKNYTSNVPVSETIHRIEKVLIEAGVSGITKEYGAIGEISAIRFHICVPHEITVRLPADKDRALEALWLDYVDGDKLNEKGDALDWGSQKRKCKKDFEQQADRTAWRIIKDWVEVQMSMIQLKQAETVQVFLPYIWDGRQTFFDRVKGSGYKVLLGPPKEND